MKKKVAVKIIKHGQYIFNNVVPSLDCILFKSLYLEFISKSKSRVTKIESKSFAKINLLQDYQTLVLDLSNILLFLPQCWSECVLNSSMNIFSKLAFLINIHVHHSLYAQYTLSTHHWFLCNMINTCKVSCLHFGHIFQIKFEARRVLFQHFAQEL